MGSKDALWRDDWCLRFHSQGAVTGLFIDYEYICSPLLLLRLPAKNKLVAHL